MLNAHLRFGWLSFFRSTEKKTTSVKVRLDRFIGEPPQKRNQATKAHLLSVIAGDTQMAAITAALSESAHFIVEGPEIPEVRVSLEEKKPQCYRASLQIPGRKRSIRHVIAVSEALASTTGATRIVLADCHPTFVWSSVAKILGLPAIPEWAEWFHDQLTWRNAITPLLGIGCSPVRIDGSREEFLSWLGEGVSSGTLTLPPENQAIRWPQTALRQILQLVERPENSPVVTTAATVE
jgi:hypothetical protein